MDTRPIDPGVLEEMLKAAKGMGIPEGQQDFVGEAVRLQPVLGFSTFFGEWGWQGRHILVHLFPRAGEADVWYDFHYTNKGRTYVPGRREILPVGLAFPEGFQAIVEGAAGLVTFDDVEIDEVKELGAWCVRFRDVSPEEWIKEGGLLEQFFSAIDQGIEVS